MIVKEAINYHKTFLKAWHARKNPISGKDPTNILEIYKSLS